MNIEKKATRCRDCQSAVKQHYQRTVFFCAEQPSTKTVNGLRRIRGVDRACAAFKAKEKNDEQH